MTHPLRPRVLAVIHSALSAESLILGSGGFRLLEYNHAYPALEARPVQTFRSPTEFLFKSGFDASVGLFGCVSQLGDALHHDDEFIYALVNDCATPYMRRPFCTTCVRRTPRSERSRMSALHSQDPHSWRQSEL